MTTKTYNKSTAEKKTSATKAISRANAGDTMQNKQQADNNSDGRATDNIAKPAEISIKIAAFSHRLVDASSKEVIELAYKEGIQIAGPIPLPRQVKRFVLPSSPNIYKRARVKYEQVTYTRLVKFSGEIDGLIERISKLNLCAGVGIIVKQKRV